MATGLGDALVGFVPNGDSDLDGFITADDYHRLDRGFLLRLSGYRWGDIDYDQSINLDDYLVTDASFVAQSLGQLFVHGRSDTGARADGAAVADYGPACCASAYAEMDARSLTLFSGSIPRSTPAGHCQSGRR